MATKALKNFDVRSLQKYVSPQAVEDLNKFLENLPVHTGNTILIIAGIAWAAAGALGLYTTVQIQEMTELRAELQEAEALEPVVPEISNVSVSSNEVQQLVDRMENIYGGLEIKASGSKVNIAANSTVVYGQFREAIGHVQSGGSGWRVRLENLCVGRECSQDPLRAVLSVNKVTVVPPS